VEFDDMSEMQVSAGSACEPAGTGPAAWRCLICQTIFEGEDCPTCAATRAAGALYGGGVVRPGPVPATGKTFRPVPSMKPADAEDAYAVAALHVQLGLAPGMPPRPPAPDIKRDNSIWQDDGSYWFQIGLRVFGPWLDHDAAMAGYIKQSMLFAQAMRVARGPLSAAHLDEAARLADIELARAATEVDDVLFSILAGTYDATGAARYLTLIGTRLRRAAATLKAHVNDGK